MRLCAAILLALTSYAAVVVAQQSQPTFPCYSMRARYTVYMADSVRELWPIGSRRLLWVEDGDEKLINKLVPEHQGESLYGDFTVCPLEPDRPGIMRHIRIASWGHLKYGPARQR